MNLELITWWVMAAVAVACAAGMISSKNPVHSALWLVGNFAALAGIFLVLSAPVLFAIQLIVYAGAIMVLFLFVIMFFMAPEARTWRQRALRRQYIIGGVLVLAFIVMMAAGMLGTDAEEAFSDQWLTSAAAKPDDSAVQSPQMGLGQPKALGLWLFNSAVLPFELTSLLLLLAILGAMLVARDVQSEGRKELPEFAAVRHTKQPAGNGAAEPAPQVVEEVQA